MTVSCAEGDTGYIYKGELKFEPRGLKADSRRREDHSAMHQDELKLNPRKNVQDLGDLPEIGLKNLGQHDAA